MDGYLLYGSSLSPFSLKTRLLCELARLPTRWLPEDGDSRINVRVLLRRLAVVHGLDSVTHPPLTELDELPLVPFLFGPGGTTYWDSSAIGAWLQETRAASLLPAESGQRWLCHYLDEYVDEFGLYLLHHHRWVTCARDTRAPQQLRREYASLLPGLAGRMAVRAFVARQVRRLPYLFSVAPEGFRVRGVPDHRQPPSRPGFAPTHELLDDAFRRMLRGIEAALDGRPYLFGESPTLADASFYGMLASQLRLDPEAARQIDELAPRVRPWVDRLERADARRPSSEPSTEPSIEPLRALVREASRTFLPLMVQNAAAHASLPRSAAGLHNERAFDRSCSLYRGEIDGRAYRSVAKTFQAAVWRRLQESWRRLPDPARESLVALDPGLSAVS